MNNNLLTLQTEFYLSDTTPILVISDYTDYVGESIPFSDVVGKLTVTDPNGNIIHYTQNYDTPDIDLSVRRSSEGINLPKNDLTQEVIKGDYIIDYSVKIGLVEYNKTFTVTLDYSFPVPVITFDIDGYTSELTVKDDTGYASPNCYGVIGESITCQFNTINEYIAIIDVSDDIVFENGDKVIIDGSFIADVEDSAYDTLKIKIRSSEKFPFNSFDTYTVVPYTRVVNEVTPPVGSGLAVKTSSDLSDIYYEPNIWSGLYSSDLVANLVYRDDLNYVYIRVTDTETATAYDFVLNDMMAGVEAILNAYDSALQNNRKLSDDLENRVVQINTNLEIYNQALRDNNLHDAYQAVVNIYLLLNEYVVPVVTPEEILPFSDSYATDTDEKVKINSSDPTSGYLIDKMYSDHFEVVSNKVRIKASAITGLSDYVSKTNGGQYDSKITYAPGVMPSANDDIPDIGWIKSQQYVNDLTASEDSGSSSGFPLSIEDGNKIKLSTDLSRFNNDANFLTENEEITLSGDVDGVGRVSIVCTIGNGKITAVKLGSNAVSGQTVASALGGTETFLGDQSGLKKITLALIQAYLKANNTLAHSDILTPNSVADVQHLTGAEKSLVSTPASTSQSGHLTSANFIIFNNKQDALTAGEGINISGVTISVSKSSLITDSVTSTTSIWSSDKILSEIASAVTSSIAYQLQYVLEQQDPDNPTVLNPGSTPIVGDRYLIMTPGSLNANFGTINKDLQGNLLTLQTNDIVEYVDTGDSSSDPYEFRIAFDASAYGNTASVVIGIDKNGEVNHTYVWNLTEWIDKGTQVLHDGLSDVKGGFYHLELDEKQALTQYNGQINDADNYHTHGSFISKTNTTVYAPTTDYHPAVKKTVDDSKFNPFVDLGSKSSNFNVDLSLNRYLKAEVTADLEITFTPKPGDRTCTTCLLELIPDAEWDITWTDLVTADWIAGEELLVLESGKKYLVSITCYNVSSTYTYRVAYATIGA